MLLLMLPLLAAACSPQAAPPPPPPPPPLEEEVFVWQQAWTPAVAEAVTAHGDDFGVVTVLRAEVDWSQDHPVPRWVSVDRGVLQSLTADVGLAVRVMPYPGAYPEEAGAALVAVVTELLAQDPWIRELHVDFDAQTHALADYAAWLRQLRGAVGSRRLSITALPDWLRQPAFAEVAAQVDRYVLQVHWLAPPQRLGEPLSLMDTARVPGWVSAAGALGVPFSVALPTYGYRVAYDPQTQEAIGINAEPGRAVPGAVWREVRADPAAAAALVAAWQAGHPAAMVGVSWYRLPVAGDTLNWRWTTLAAVRQGRAPQPTLAPRIEADGHGLVDVWLRNDGDAGADVQAISVAWQAPGVSLLAADGLGGLRWDAAARRFQVPPEVPVWLAAGEERAIGWLRLSAPAAVTATVISSPERD